MRSVFALFISVFMIVMISGCSNDFAFSEENTGVSFTYNDHEYNSILKDNCEYEYDSDNMVFLLSIPYGKLNNMGEAYNVYRHKDDEAVKYLFVIPKPSIRDMTPLAFILTIEEK